MICEYLRIIRKNSQNISIYQTMLIQPFISFLALVALVGVFRRLKKGTITRVEFLVWVLLWLAVGILVWVPQITNIVAGLLGVGRGADAVFYVSIVVIFYILFRLYGKIENLEHQLSTMAKKIALKDIDRHV